jgi:hypothetical protein
MSYFRLGLALALALGALPPSALGFCYTVIDRSNTVVWRGTVSPIDLSRSVSDGMRRVFPPGHMLVISEEAQSCAPIGPQEIFGGMPGVSGPPSGLPQWQSGMTAGGARK